MVIVYLNPHEDIIVLPLNQVKKLFHVDQTQHPQELGILVSLRIDWKQKFYLVQLKDSIRTIMILVCLL